MDRGLFGNLKNFAVSFQLSVFGSQFSVNRFFPGYNIGVSSSSAAVEPEQRSFPTARPFTLRQRILLWFISRASYLAISLIGPTLRYSISWEEPPSPPDATFEKPVIYCFWHRAVFPSSWIWRNTGIAVMVSRSFDGEYIARTLEKLGFVAVRGSSSRDGAKALLGLRSQLQKGTSVVFTIDGPRGPKYVAKPGPVLLPRQQRAHGGALRRAQRCLGAEYLGRLDDPQAVFQSAGSVGAKMQVPAETKTEKVLEGDKELAGFHRQLQAALERVTAFAEEHAGQVGSADFP